MGPILKFTAGFAIAGFLISLFFGWIGGNRPVNIIVTAVVCALVAGALGAGTFRFLEMRVPEILSIFRRNTEALPIPEPDYEPDTSPMESGSPGGEISGGMEDAAEGAPAAAVPISTSTAASGSAAFGDHILVNKVKIKNEPKLMAAAIRTILAKDDK